MGSSKQVFSEVAENEGLRRLGNSYLNLMPIPRSLNRILGANNARGEFMTNIFATAIYSTIVFGPAQIIAALEDE